MSARLQRHLALLVLAVLIALLPACAPRAATPIPSGVAAAQPVPTLAPATATPLPPTPTATATPLPPTPTPSPVAADAAFLFKQAQGKQQAVKSARGLMEIAVKQPQPVTMLVEFEVAEPDMRMALSGQGLLSDFEIEFVVKGDLAYMRMGDQWITVPGGKGEVKSNTNIVGVDDFESFLKDASSAKSIGRRNVKGVECEVISFQLSPEKLRELATLRGKASAQRAMDEDVEIEQFRGEVAIGVADRLLHQMVFDLSGYEKRGHGERFAMTFTITLWDINSPDIEIKAPDVAKTGTLRTARTPVATRMPTATPPPGTRIVNAHRSSTRPTVDGVISSGEGWDKMDAVRGPYADGTIEIKSLHDGTNLYLLLVWDEKLFTEAQGLYMIFEDGGAAPQRSLDGKNDDAKYVTMAGLPDGYRDARWSGGWQVGETAHGGAAGRHSSGKMIVEWWGPLSSGTDDDISVSANETLGFAIVNFASGSAGQRGAWPRAAMPYDAGTWGTLVVHY